MKLTAILICSGLYVAGFTSGILTAVFLNLETTPEALKPPTLKTLEYRQWSEPDAKVLRKEEPLRFTF